MDELKKWLLNRIGENNLPGWQYAYQTVLEEILQIESNAKDAGFEKWYDTQVPGGDVRSIACKNLCRQSWKAALEYANKTGQENSSAQS